MADVDDFIARHKQRLAQHQRELDEVDDETVVEPEQRPHDHHASSGFAEDESAAAGVAANPHGHTWADAGRASAVRSSDGPGSAAREYRNHTNAPRAPMMATGSPARSSTSARYLREYVIDSPTSVYDRSQRWASQRDKAVARQRDEKDVLATSDCTFQPSRAAVTPGKATKAGGGVSATRKRGSSSDSPRVDAASYYQHIQRQEGARRDRDDQKRKVAVDTATWRNRTTTPREFTFGQRKGNISALRKPCVGLTPRDAQSHSEKLWASEEADEIDISEDETTTAAAANRPRAAAPAAHQQHQQPQTSRQKAAAASSSSAADGNESAVALERANADIVKLTKELMQMRSKSDRQEEEIARLGGSVVSLKRELDAAKAKLRHYALGGQ